MNNTWVVHIWNEKLIKGCHMMRLLVSNSVLKAKIIMQSSL